MNLGIMLHIIKKETMALLRNKKVLVGIFAPIVILPIIFYGYLEITKVTSRETEISKSGIYLEGDLPTFINNALLQDDRFEVLTQKDNADLVLEYALEGSKHQFILKYDFGRNASMRAGERIAPILLDFKEAQQAALLESEGLDFAHIYPTQLEYEDLATEKEVAGYSMGNIMPLIITLYAMISVLSFAMELSTTEKETGTLETIFSVPIKKSELVTAKLLACVLFGMAALTINLGVILLLLPKVMDVSSFGLNMGFSTFMALVINIIPLTFMGAALSLGIGMFANSYKESNAYMTPLIFVFMLPAYLASTPGLELNLGFSLVPIVNTTLLIKSVFMGQLNMALFSATLVTNTLFSIMGLVFMFKVFGTENILFGNQKGFSFAVKRSSIKKSTFMQLEDVYLSLAVITVLYIYASVILPGHMGIFENLVFNQYVFFAMLPIGIIWYLKASHKESLGLRAPSAMGSFGGVWIWLSAFSLSLIYQIIITPYIDFVPTLVELEGKLEAMSPFTKFFLIALTPGICEEILFRGFALRPLEKRLGAKWAVIITAIAFSLMHLDVVRLIPTFLLGIAFGYVAVKTKSIYPPIVLHVLNNSVAIFLPEGTPVSYAVLVPLFIASLALGLGIYKKLDNVDNIKSSF